MDDPSHSSTKTKRATVGFDGSASGPSSVAAAAAAAASVDRGGADRSVGRWELRCFERPTAESAARKNFFVDGRNAVGESLISRCFLLSVLRRDFVGLVQF